MQRNRKTNNAERRNGDPTEAKRLNVKKPNTNDKKMVLSPKTAQNGSTETSS